MKKYIIALAIGTFCTNIGWSQTLDTNALSNTSPSVSLRVWEVARHVKLSAEEQQKLARAFEACDSEWFAMMASDNGIEAQSTQRRYQKLNDKAISKILNKEQQEQYYRGVFNAEANAEGNAVADRLQKKYGLTDQNWKFIRIAFYKIALDSRVINKMLADKPAEAKKKIAALRKEQLATIEAKGGIRVDAEGKTVKVIKPFEPNTLHKD